MDKINPAQNFLSTMDRNLIKKVHVRNAVLDSHKYKWPFEILQDILNGIETAYEKDNQDE